MKARWLELTLVALLAAVTLLWAFFPPSGRPGDLDLHVTVHPADAKGGSQTMTAIVQWHWQRRPWLRLGHWYDELGFVFDGQRWTMVMPGNRWYSSGGEAVAIQTGNPFPTMHLGIDQQGDGEMTFSFVSKLQNYQATDLPLQVEFIHVRDESMGPLHSGWVKLASPDSP